MKIQNILPQKLNNENKKENENVRFTGAADIALRFLDTNQAWGANAVDLGSMVIPRTTVDFVNRGPAAGTETARREASGTINHSLIGVYGSAAAMAFALTLNNKFGIRADKIFADSDTIDVVGNTFHKHVKAGEADPLKSSLKEIFTTVRTNADGKEVGLSAKDVDTVVDRMIGSIRSSDIDGVTIPKTTKHYLENFINHATGSENDFKISGGLKKESTTSLATFIENVYNLSKTFTNEKVLQTFKDSADFDANKFVKSLKSVNMKRTVVGMAVASGLGMCIQPMNIYLTKKKTGSDGFVGVEGREKDNSANFKLMKGLASAIFGGGIIGHIAMKEGGLLRNIQFKGMTPTLNQFKLIYGLTIMSRFMVARDKDELRESVVKDVLGFLNWLVLGNFVAKGVAMAMDKDKSLLKNPAEAAKSFFKAKMKTRDEVLIAGLKKLGLSSVKDGKALSFKEMLKLVPKNASGAPISKQLRVLNRAQVAGYLYSGIVLGFGIPKLNIWMTNKSEAKRQAILAEKKAKMPASDRMLDLKNVDFLKNQQGATLAQFTK